MDRRQSHTSDEHSECLLRRFRLWHVRLAVIGLVKRDAVFGIAHHSVLSIARTGMVGQNHHNQAMTRKLANALACFVSSVHRNSPPSQSGAISAAITNAVSRYTSRLLIRHAMASSPATRICGSDVVSGKPTRLSLGCASCKCWKWLGLVSPHGDRAESPPFDDACQFIFGMVACLFVGATPY